MSQRTIDAFCDGSCPRARGPGGWAYAIVMDAYRECNILKSGFKELTTNNEMEVKAALECLKRIEDLGYKDHRVTIYSDSRYCVYGFETWRHNWAFDDFKQIKRQVGVESVELANGDLWRECHQVAERFSLLKFKWVRGHNGHYWNERVDKMAVSAMKIGRRGLV